MACPYRIEGSDAEELPPSAARTANKGRSAWSGYGDAPSHAILHRLGRSWRAADWHSRLAGRPTRFTLPIAGCSGLGIELDEDRLDRFRHHHHA